MSYFTIPSLVVLGTYVLIPWATVYIAYSLWFHPLQRYPGPLLARLTDFYGGFYAFKGDLHLRTYANFQKHGDVLRQAPNRLIFNTVTALHDIYSSPKVTKGQAYHGSKPRTKFPSVFNAFDRDNHRRKRQLIGPSVSERGMRVFEPIMQEQVDVFLQRILETADGRGANPCNMSEWLAYLGLDIVGKLSFGFDLKTQTELTYRYAHKLIEVFGWRVNVYMQFPPIKPIELLLLLLGAKQLIKFDHCLRTMIKARMQADKDAYPDLFSHVVNQMVPGKENDRYLGGELWSEAVLFLSAGGATTATAMSATFFYLSQNPESYAALASEIRSTFNSASEIHAGPKLTGCKYLRACIDEAMRMSPPFLTPPWREQEHDAQGAFTVDGHVIPKGTQVGVSLYSLLHNDKYFPDPFTYTPERWLEPSPDHPETETEKAARRTMRQAFAPFLIGDRGCAGKAMAYLEASLVLAQTIWYFDFETAAGKHDELRVGKHHSGEFPIQDIVVSRSIGPYLVFYKRGEHWKELEARRL